MILILLGILICIFAFPKIRRPIMQRLFNEGIITPKQIAPEEAEIIRYAGPNLSLFFIGVIFIIIGIIIK